MKSNIIFLSAALLALSAAPALAAEEKKQVTTEQHDVQVDGLTGQVNQQHKAQKDTTKSDISAAGTRVEQEHTSEAAATAESPTGHKDEAREKTKAKTAVTANAHGDVAVEQKKQHTEERAHTH